MVGTKQCEFVEINEKSGDSKIISCGHGSGELWGLAAHPSMEKFVSASDDGTVRLWDITSRVCFLFHYSAAPPAEHLSVC